MSDLEARLIVQCRNRIRKKMKKHNWGIHELRIITGIDEYGLNWLVGTDIVGEENDIQIEILERLEKIENEIENIDLKEVKKMLNSMKDLDGPYTFCVYARKGGNGKSTISLNIAYTLTQLGYNVLVIDADSQTDMTTLLHPDFYQVKTSEKEKNIYNALINQDSLKNYFFGTHYPNLHLIPGSAKLERTEEFTSLPKDVVRRGLEKVKDEKFYDFIIVDMDKNAGIINELFMNACDGVIVPAEAALLSVRAVGTALARTEQIREYNSDLKCLGIVFSRVVPRRSQFKMQKENVSEYFDVPIFKTFIESSAIIEAAQDEEVPVYIYSRRSKPAQQFIELTKEVVEQAYIHRQEQLQKGV